MGQTNRDLEERTMQAGRNGRASGGRAALSFAGALAGVALALTVGMSLAGAQQGQEPSSSVRPPPGAATSGGRDVVQPELPGNYDIDMWKKVREGLQGQVSIPDKKAGQLVQSDGEAWRNFRNGPLPKYGLWAMGGIVVLLAAFFLLRGRIPIEHGWAGWTITRFSDVERFGHWLLASSFVILALTGTNVLYGRYFLLPLLGAGLFSEISHWGKWLHNYVAFAFMIALAITFVVWIRHNFPSWRDIVWLAKGGGLLVRGSHPPAWKFNAGQKIVFWLVMLGGLSLSLSGLALLFPFQTALFAKTFAVLNALGSFVGLSPNLPTQLTPLQEMQHATTWHGIVALGLVVVIIAHIYIGTLGMQGAFSAMGTGQVDVNWAKEHHSLWAEREIGKMEDVAAAVTDAARVAPAE
jgi:formate dehydrogenase subunit gamma